MNSIQEWFAGLEPREQKLVSIGGVVGIVLVFIMGIWQPLNAKLELTESKLRNQQELNIWAKDAIQRIKNSGKAMGRSGGSLTQIVNQTSRRFNIEIARLQPKDTAVVVWIELINFNDLLRWIDHLERNNQVTVSAFDVTDAEEAGFVKVRKLQFEMN